MRVRPAPSTDLVVDTSGHRLDTWTRCGKERESARGRETEDDDDDGVAGRRERGGV